jgi:hypothetical protein
MESFPLIGNNMNNRRTTTCEIIDKSEPCIVLAGICSTLGLIVAIVNNYDFLIIMFVILLAACLISEWRIRALGIAKHLMESVHTLQKENLQLKEEIEKFEGIVGILGDNVGSIHDAKNELFKMYNQYKIENNRYESNNLLTLFGLVDKDQNSRLDTDEIDRMKEYIKIVYKEEYDFSTLDRDGDGTVSIKEFFEKFRHDNDNNNNNNNKNREVIIDFNNSLETIDLEQSRFINNNNNNNNDNTNNI